MDKMALVVGGGWAGVTCGNGQLRASWGCSEWPAVGNGHLWMWHLQRVAAGSAGLGGSNCGWRTVT